MVNLPQGHLGRQLYSNLNLEQAFAWLCEQEGHGDVWDYRRAWTERKSDLRLRLLNGNYQFKTVSIVEFENPQGKTERREVRCAEDRLVIRALAQVLQPILQPRLSKHCTHIKGNGGLKQAVRDTQEYLNAHPDCFVMKSDVKGYYAHIDHAIVMEQLGYCLPNEPEIQRLVWLFMRRTTEFGGNYADVQTGLPLGASLSPLLGGLYLSPMDALFARAKGIFYRRYMDDWVIMQDKRHGLRSSVKMVYGVLDALGMQVHPDKTFIGNANKCFDFLGFALCTTTGVSVSAAALSRRDEKIARLYERGASKRRIGLYLACWLGWATMVPNCAFGENNPLYTAYGVVLNEQCERVPDVEVTANAQTVSTDAAGLWEIPGLPAGEYTGTASKPNFVFAPESISLDNDESQQDLVVFRTISKLKVSVVTDPHKVTQGNNVAYLVTVINGGDETATNVSLSNVLPQNAGGLISIEALDGGECDADTVTCILPDLTHGNSARVKLVLGNKQTNSLLNTATVTSNEYPPDVQETQTRVIPYLSTSITDSPDPLQLPLPGDPSKLHYDLAVTLSANAPSPATNVKLGFTVPKSAELNSINSDFGMCDISKLPIITCQLTDLSVDGADSINHVTVGVDVDISDTAVFPLTLEADVSANEYPNHTDTELTNFFPNSTVKC